MIKVSWMWRSGSTGESMRKLSSEGVGLRRKVCLTGDWAGLMLASICSDRCRRADGKSGSSMLMAIFENCVEHMKLAKMLMVLMLKNDCGILPNGLEYF